jgi:hypothetical protein
VEELVDRALVAVEREHHLRVPAEQLHERRTVLP